MAGWHRAKLMKTNRQKRHELHYTTTYYLLLSDCGTLSIAALMIGVPVAVRQFVSRKQEPEPGSRTLGAGIRQQRTPSEAVQASGYLLY